MENLIKSTKIEFKFLYFKLHKYYLDTKMGNMILTGFENANESRKNEPARIRQMEQEKQAAHARMMEGYANGMNSEAATATPGRTILKDGMRKSVLILEIQLVPCITIVFSE